MYTSIMLIQNQDHEHPRCSTISKDIYNILMYYYMHILCNIIMYIIYIIYNIKKHYNIYNIIFIIYIYNIDNNIYIILIIYIYYS
jgi:hypothetical protein